MIRVVLDDPLRAATYASYVPRAVLERLPALRDGPATPRADTFPAALLLLDITGFTQLTEAAVRGGPVGTERLARAVDTFMDRVIGIVSDHGGDVVKIVGDGLVPIWPAIAEDLAAATSRAATCGLAIAAEMSETELGDGLRLSLKVGLCAGAATILQVGGLDGRWHFLVAGAAAAQLARLEGLLHSGAVIASPEASAAAEGQLVGDRAGTEHVRVTSVRDPLERHGTGRLEVPTATAEIARSYVPEVCLERLDAGQAGWLAELRRTTVIFASVRAVGRGPIDGVDVLQRLALGAQRVARRFDAWLKEITVDDKGLSLVAVLGVPPFSHEDDPGRAVEASLALRAEIRDLGLETGVGVATGVALCGPVGNASRRDFAVLGGHVNLAARLMQASAAGTVLCDVATHDGAPDRRSFERLPAFVLKGQGAPIDVYRVLAPMPVAARSSGMVDRTSELATAIAMIDGLREGTGGTLLIEGEPGIGKSRVVAELVRYAGSLALRPLVGLASELDSATPYHAWRAVFERLLETDVTTDLATRRRIVIDALAAHDGAARLAPLLDPVLSIDLPDNEVTSQLIGAVRGDNTNDLLVRILTSAVSEVPAMVVLEDVHWLDSASWSLVQAARRSVPHLLVVLTTRPVVGPSADPVAGLRHGARIIRLGPLSADDAVALVTERTGAAAVAVPVASLIGARAEGNPLFIEQLTYALRDTGRIVVEAGQVRLAAGDPARAPVIPDTVQRVITSRLDQLPPAEALTVKVASVVGQTFAARTLHEIYPLPIEPETLVRHLEMLGRLDLIAPVRSAAEPTYEFGHVITREVAYGLMVPSQSRELHRALAEWYERAHAADLAPYHVLLAHHWRSAGDAARAVDHLERAGEWALRTFANEEAIVVLEEAIALEAEAGLDRAAGTRARSRLRLGDAYVNMSRYREGRPALEAGLRLLGRGAPASRPHLAGAVLASLVRQALRRAHLIGARGALTTAEHEEFVAVCRAYERLAEAAYYDRETLLPLYAVIRILNEAESSGIPAEIARGLAGTAALFGVVPLHRVADWYLRRALEMLERVDDLATHEIVGIVVAFYAIGAARWDLARERLETVRAIALELGDRRRLDDATGNLAELAAFAGSFETAAALADELIRNASARNDDRYRAEALVHLAMDRWQLADADAALSAVSELDGLLAGPVELTDELRLRVDGVGALIHADRDDWPAAKAAADRAMVASAGQRPASFGTFLGYVGPAEAYLRRWETRPGDAEARDRAKEALRRLRAFAGVFPVGRPRSATLEGRAQWLRGDRERALRTWDSAIGMARGLAMPYEEGRAHVEIARHLGGDDGRRPGHIVAAVDRFEAAHATRDLSALGSLGDGAVRG